MKNQSRIFWIRWTGDFLILVSWGVIVLALDASWGFTVGVGFLLWMQLRHMSITQSPRK